MEGFNQIQYFGAILTDDIAVTKVIVIVFPCFCKMCSFKETSEVFSKSQSGHKNGLLCGNTSCTFCMCRSKFLGELYVSNQISHSTDFLTS